MGTRTSEPDADGDGEDAGVLDPRVALAEQENANQHHRDRFAALGQHLMECDGRKGMRPCV